MNKKKVSRKQIEKFIVSELEERLNLLGWKLIEKDTNYFSKKYNEEIDWGFNFSLYNSKAPFSLFFKVYIHHIKYTKIINDLVTDFQNLNFFGGVRLWSSKIPKNKKIIHILNLSEVQNFVDNMIVIINKSEQEFWLPYSNIENTISEFRRTNHVFWPNSTLSSFVSYMIAYAIENNDKETIKFTIDRVNELLKTKIFERDRNFVEHIIKSVSK